MNNRRADVYPHRGSKTFWRKLGKDVWAALIYAKKFWLGCALVGVAVGAAAQSQGAPVDIVRVAGVRLSSTTGGVPIYTIAGTSVAIVCTDAGGARISCGASGSAGASGVTSVFVTSGTVFANIISTFSASNPGYVQFPSAQAITASALPLPAGAAIEAGNLATIAAKDFATQTTLSDLNAKVTAVNTGAVTISAALPAGANNIGDVDVLTLPALPTGTNNVGTVNGSTTAVVPPNGGLAATVFHNVRLTDGSGFYSAGSGSGGPTTVTPGTGTFSVALSSLTYTGTSANVNCTGGCGSPTQAVSFVAVATVTITQGATHYTLMNHAGSTATIKVQRVDIAMYSDAAVTGVVTNYQMYLITATTVTGNGSQVRFHRIDTNDNNIAPGVTLSTGGSPTIPTIAVPSNVFGAASMTSEETTLVDPAVLYDYRNLGDKPLVLRAGRGFTIKQAPLPAAAAGKVIIRAFFTQE